MEKFKLKIESLRGELDKAQKHADELRVKSEQLESTYQVKEEEVTSLTNRVKNLEEIFEETEINMVSSTKDFREADLRAEQLSKKIIKLEQEIGIWDKKNADLQEKYDKAKGEMDELEGNLEDV